MKHEPARGAAPGSREPLSLRLYVAGQAPNSAAAIRNLGILFPGGESSGQPVKIEIVDVLREPLRGLADGVLLSPTLVRLAPPPVRRVVGNLSNHEAVLLALGVAP
ncbi:MAG: circadian clock protein KaiB [Thermoanaerobaculia bacterium]|nr:circadian clock protein KaiB [Thermoanaerobaculia bacterium]